MSFTLQEIEAALQRYQHAAHESARGGDWSAWADCFTDDVHYIEHHYGELHGKQTVLDWIQTTMNAWPFTHMQLFPWDWYTIDVEQGFVVGQVENGFVDPGDGGTYQSANWTRLMYAGDGRFSSEEDVYNPANFAPTVSSWLRAWAAHHPDQPNGPTDSSGPTT